MNVHKQHHVVSWAKAHLQAKGDGTPYSLINPATPTRAQGAPILMADEAPPRSIHPLAFFGQSMNHLAHLVHHEDTEH